MSDNLLRADIRLLGDTLGRVLRRIEGQALYDHVERIRASTKGGGLPVDEVRDLPVEEALPLARAFTHFLSLANIAEQHHRERRRRDYLAADQPSQRGSLDDSVERLLAQGLSGEALRAQVLDLHIELVLTAHPTEVNRRTLLHKHNAIGALLDERDRAHPHELPDIDLRLERLVTEIWCTDEVHRRKPSPYEEAQGGLLVFEQTLWDALPAYLRRLDGVLEQHCGEGLPLDAAPITFGSWMGGDRDGNPNVTAPVTRRVCAMHRWLGSNQLWIEVDRLRAELSMEPCSPELRAAVGPGAEPYRWLLGMVRTRLEATRAAAAAEMEGAEPPEGLVYRDPSELREALMLVWRSLIHCGCEVVASGRLEDLLRRLATFGLTLVKLDLRQEADRHSEALDAVTQALGLGSYLAWDEPERQRWLLQELASPRPLVPRALQASAEIHEVLETFRVIGEQPEGTFGAYVISMATTPSDVLAVELLQKDAGVIRPLRVVPLFETLDDLAGAGAAVERLLAVRPQAELEVMLGYSDSAKDAGRLCAAWALYQGQEDLVRVCAAAGTRLTLFHGRGGSVGRGGGPMHQAIRSQPGGSIAGRLRVTEQGEVVQARFGLPGVAARSLDLYTTAVLEATVNPPAVPEPAWRQEMDELAERALQVYRGVVRGHPDFVPYFRAATPEPELSGLKIGSRPARRRAGGGVESLRAIPWIFAWTQTRLLLPSWLGVEALNGGDPDRLEEMAQRWPFFDATLGLVEMVLAKSRPSLAEVYDQRLVPDHLRGLGLDLRARLKRTVQAMEQVRGRAIIADNTVLRRSIDVRNPYVDPLNLLQAELLRAFRASPEPALEDALKVTINGIAAGMRNTG